MLLTLAALDTAITGSSWHSH